MNNKPVICTVVAKNYLAFARCLTDSFLSHHPEGQVFVLLVDELEDSFDPAQERFTTVLASEIGVPNFRQMAFRYFVFELSTAVKPFFFDYLFKTYNCQKLCYIDPDIYFYQPLDEIFELLDSYGLILLPHLTGFLDDGFQPDELAILRSGAYNLGFLGMSQHPELESFLHWWQRKLYKHCVGEQERGLFLDQRWMDLAPTIFPSVHIHRDPGYNVAYWNLNHRQIERAKDVYRVNGSPLKFFHFSGFPSDNIEAVARYQNRFTLDKLDHLRPLFYEYRDRLLTYGHQEIRGWRYAYDYFENGMYIPAYARYLWRELDEDGQRWSTPFNPQGDNSFANWLNQPADGHGQLLLTNLALETYRRRMDIHQVFRDVLGRDRLEFARWFVEKAAHDHQLDSFFIEPVAASIARFVKNRVNAQKSDNRLASSSPADSQNGRTLNWGAKTYLHLRNFVNRVGIGQRIRAVIGPEQVLRVRQTFFFGSPAKAKIHQQTAYVPPRQTFKKIDWDSQAIRQLGDQLGLNVIGYLRDETGIGEVARSILKALHRQNFPVAQTNIEGYLARQEDTSALYFPSGNPYSINLFNVNADQSSVVQENLGDEFFQGRYNIGFWFWELSHFPEMWHDRFKYFDEIWVASNFVQAAVAQVAPIPVVNVRVPIIKPEYSDISRADLGLPPDKHLFLFVFDGLSYVERKNPLGLLRAYHTAFAPHFNETQLVIKATHLSRNPKLAAILHEEIEKVSGILIDRYMSRDELNGLFQMCDTYISLHRSEGFALTIAESMSLGKPVIATAYSANMDFMSPANSYPVAYRLIELEEDYGPYQKGNLWAEPDVEAAAAMMKCVVENPEEARQRGKLAQQDIERFYGIETVSKIIIERLKTIQRWS